MKDPFVSNTKKFIVPNNRVGYLLVRELRNVITCGCGALPKTLKTLRVKLRKINGQLFYDKEATEITLPRPVSNDVIK